MTRPTILVVDDEPFICRSLTYILRKEAYRVLEARNGEEGLAMIRAEKPDLVFLDVMMPKLDGYDVTKQVRADDSLADVKIVLLTARGQESDKVESRALGVVEHMTKPFSPSRILDFARKVLGG
jgi:DNA-binding response OmpR family regulator